MVEFNHICANPNCPNKIVDSSGRALPNYYACDDCDRSKGITWRFLCCSRECFNEYYNIATGAVKKSNTVTKKSKKSKRAFVKANEKVLNETNQVTSVETETPSEAVTEDEAVVSEDI